jgi:hypothetical protein
MRYRYSLNSDGSRPSELRDLNFEQIINVFERTTGVATTMQQPCNTHATTIRPFNNFPQTKPEP